MKYTAVFEFEGEPTINKSDTWLGGKLCSVQFSDALEELDALQEKIDDIEDWYNTDGSVGGLSRIMEPDDE